MRHQDLVFCLECGEENNRFGPRHICSPIVLEELEIAKTDDVEVRRLGHGGPGRGQGRHEEPGYSKTVKLRFLSQDEELAIKEFTPRQRVEILLATLSSRKPNNNFLADRTATTPKDTSKGGG